MKKTILSTLISIAILGTSIAQDITNYIPKDNSFVMTIRASNVLKKCNIDKISEMIFFKKLNGKLSRNIARSYGSDKNMFNTLLSINNPFGINLQKVYFIYQTNDSIESQVLFISLSDTKAFEEFVKNAISAEEDIIHNEKDYKWITDDKITIAWNSNMAILINLDMSWNYYYNYVEIHQEDKYIEDAIIEEDYSDTTSADKDYDYYRDYYSESQEKKDKIEIEWTTNKIKELMNLNSKNTVSSNSNFKAAQEKDFDIQFWMDYSNYTNLYKEIAPFKKTSKAFSEFTDDLMNIYHDSYISINLTSNKGKLELTTETHVNNELKKLYDGIYDVKLNPNFGKYINQENLLGYFGFAVNIKKTVEASKNIILPALQESEEYGKMAKAILDLADIIVDEETLYNIFKGDFILAVTDIKEQEVTYTDYEYDEDFNYTAVEKTKMEKLPEFVTMMSVGNKEHVQTLVDLIEGSRFISKNGSYYKLKRSFIPFDIYLALNDDVLLMTNNLSLASKGMKKGISAKKQLNATNKDLLSKNNIIAYTNISKIFEKLASLTNKDKIKDLEMFNFFKKNTEDFITTGVSVTGNVYGSHSALNVPDKNVEAWYFLAKMMEDFNTLTKK